MEADKEKAVAFQISCREQLEDYNSGQPGNLDLDSKDPEDQKT